jgi:hypothetical protein
MGSLARALVCVGVGAGLLVLAGPAAADPPTVDSSPPSARQQAAGFGFDFDVPHLQLRTTTRYLARGLTVTGSCEGSCHVQGGLALSPRRARDLGLGDALLVSNDATWNGFGRLRLRTGPAGRQALKRYRGHPFTVVLSMSAIGKDQATGEAVDSGVAATKIRVVPTP